MAGWDAEGTFFIPMKTDEAAINAKGLTCPDCKTSAEQSGYNLHDSQGQENGSDIEYSNWVCILQGSYQLFYRRLKDDYSYYLVLVIYTHNIIHMFLV